MAGVGDGNHNLWGDNKLLIDAITTQMERMMREHTKELYERIEQLENQGNHNGDGGRKRRRRDNDGGDAREDIIEEAKLNIPPLMRINEPRWKGTKIPKELISHKKMIAIRVRPLDKIRVGSIKNPRETFLPN